MGKPNPPDPPDPQQVAAAQTAQNVSTAKANAYLGNVNQITPDGRVTFKKSGGEWITNPETGDKYRVPRFTQEVKLDRSGRMVNEATDDTKVNLSRLARNVSGDLRKQLREPFDPGDLPEVRYGGKARREAEAALMERMNPQLEQERDALATRLANQGVNLGSAAYDRAMQNYGQQANDARLGAIINAGQESDRMFRQTSGARDQAMREAFAIRNQPINEVSALMSGSQVQAPQAFAPNMPSMPTVDVAGLEQANYQGRLQAYQQKMGARNAMMGGLFDVASAGVGVI